MEVVEPKYKQTEVGLIPSDWKVSAIESFVKITTGDKDTKDSNDKGEYPFFVRSQKVEKIPTYSFDGEAILTSGDGVGVGKIYHYINGKFDFHQRVYCLHDFNQNVFGKYFFYQFANKFYDRVMSMTAKSSVDSVRRDMITRMKVPLPPTLHEQKAIATALSDVDALIQKLDDLIEKKQNIKKATMQLLLTGKKRLDGFTEDWEEMKLDNICEFKKGKGLPKSSLKEDGNNKCIHYGQLFKTYGAKIESVKSKTDDKENKVVSKNNDVLMPTSDVTPNGLATASCILEDDVILGGDIMIIRPNRNQVNGTFLSYSIMSDRVQVMSFVSGTTVYHLYSSEMKNFAFKLPPIKEQNAIVYILNDIQELIEKLQSSKEKLTRIKRGMMQELLTGKIRME